jgi:hypothetical protein
MRYRGGGGGSRFLLFIIFLLFAAYFLNAPFTFFKIPAFLTKIDKWIIFAGGVLLVLGAFNYLRVSRRYY